MTAKKLKNRQEITEICQNLKKKGERIVAYNGSFDLLHLGHIHSLMEAKKQGDILVVLLNSDKSVKKYKGPNRPIISQKDRAKMLTALECVDYVVIFNEINPKEILRKIKPHIYCKGPDWGKNCIEKETVEESGGKIHLLKHTPGISTSGIIKKILDIFSKPEIKAVFLDRDGTINVNKPEYLHKIKDFKFTPFAIEALQRLSKTDYKIIIVTNQSGIRRNYFRERDLKKLHHWLQRELKRKKIRIDRIYYCPHVSEDNCSCQKPKIGMLLRAVKDFNINLSKSWMVGDSGRDILMGREVNLKTIKIGDRLSKNFKVQPHFYAKNLSESIKIILGQKVN